MMGAGDQRSGDELYELQKKVRANAVAGPKIVAFGFSKPVNIASLLRVADAAGCQHVLFVDHAPVISQELKRVARNADRIVPWATCASAELDAHLDPSFPLVALELTTASQSLFDAVLPVACTFVVGSERHGISKDLLARCISAVHVPMFGVNGSMNVTHALAIALYEWRRKYR